ncbi:MAG: hypothetical protein ABID63_10805 [Pseudomonadota bacterium]
MTDPVSGEQVPDTALDDVSAAIMVGETALVEDAARMVCVPGADSSDAEKQAFYRELGVPETPEEYQIAVADELGGVDEAVNHRLHAAGFTPDQVQLVYDLAAEILLPLSQQMTQQAEWQQHAGAERQILEGVFGGAAGWAKIAPQIAQWGKTALPPAAYDAMGETAAGVQAMYRLMMQDREPGLTTLSDGAGGEDDRGRIRRLMNDPRYWRDGDPGIVAEVRAAFGRLQERSE